MNASNQPARLRPFRPQPFGRYTLLSHLATGGMGEIYLARLEGAQGFEKLCVIKKILPQLAADTEFVERFVGEARTLVHLSHGSIAQVLDMGVYEGEAYMALEHVDGKDLRKVAARVRDRQMPLPLTFILFVMGRVLDALAYAHRKRDDDGEELRLVHRDISPQNILISYEGEVKVIDFGLAKSRLSAAKTNPSIILGKFLYMSPEQARHQPVDRRADLYAVGLCLYELICGQNPFDSLQAGELMTAVANPKIAPLDEVEPLTPRPVTALVAKALAVDPSQRFQTAEEFRGRLQTCLMEIDASAGPESVSRFMRELFAADFQSERRLLASLKEVPRVPSAEARAPAASSEEAAPAPRPTLPAMLAPKTIRLDGPVEPLSFRPTPRNRDDNGPVSDGETRPGVMVDESTRPAFPIEALEEEARARAARQQAPALSAEPPSSVEVRPEAYVRSPEPAPPPPPRAPSMTREVPMSVLPPEAIPPAPEPKPATPDLRPTELALPTVPWEDSNPVAAPLPPVQTEPTEPRGEPLRGAAPAEITTAPSLQHPSAPQRGPAEVTTATGLPLPSAQPQRGPAEVTTATGLPLPPSAPSRPAMSSPPAAPPAPRMGPALTASGSRPALAPVAPAAPPAVAPRTGVVVMPAVSVTPSSPPPPPRPLSMTSMPAVVAPAASAPAARAAPPPSEEPDIVQGRRLAGEDASAELSAPEDVPGTEESELPVVTPEQMGYALGSDELGEADTNPRISVPSRELLHEDTQPRVVRESDTDPRATPLRHDATQPRVVLDEALLRDVEKVEEPSNPSRPRTATRRPRTASSVSVPAQVAPRRTGTGSIPAVRPAPPRVEVSLEDDEDADVRVSMSRDETRRTAVPVRPNAPAAEVPAITRRIGEDTRRAAAPATAAPASPQRPIPVMIAVAVVALLLVVAMATLVLSPGLREGTGPESPPEELAPPLPLKRPPGSGGSDARGPTGSAPTDEAPAEPEARAEAAVPAPQAVPAAGTVPTEGASALAVEPAKATVPAEAVNGAEAPAPGTVAEAAAEPPAAVPAPGGEVPEGAQAAAAAPAAEAAAAPVAEPTAEPGAEAAKVAPAVVAQAPAEEVPEAPAPEVVSPEDEALAGLVPPAPAPEKQRSSTKRTTSRKVRPVVRSPRDSLSELTQLQREWKETNALFNDLTSTYDCGTHLGTWCAQYKDIKRAVEAAGDNESPPTLKRVLKLKRVIQDKKKQLEY